MFGVVHYDDDAGTFAERQHFEPELAELGREARADGAVLARPRDRAAGRPHGDRHAEDAGVTSVILAGDPCSPSSSPRRRPRRAIPRVGGPRLHVHRHRVVRTPVRPAAVGARVRRDPAPRAHDGRVDELGDLLAWQNGTSRATKTFRELVQAPLMFFTGVHLAGANLTAKTFAAGLFRYPPAATTAPTRCTCRGASTASGTASTSPAATTPR